MTPGCDQLRLLPVKRHSFFIDDYYVIAGTQRSGEITVPKTRWLSPRLKIHTAVTAVDAVKYRGLKAEHAAMRCRYHQVDGVEEEEGVE
jgi:hypothetical protein